MSLLVRKDMQLSTDPFTAHHLVVKRPSQLDDCGVTTKRNKPDEDTVATSTGKQADKGLNGERHGDPQPEVCIHRSLSFSSPLSCVQLAHAINICIYHFFVAGSLAGVAWVNLHDLSKQNKDFIWLNLNNFFNNP